MYLDETVIVDTIFAKNYELHIPEQKITKVSFFGADK